MKSYRTLVKIVPVYDLLSLQMDVKSVNLHAPIECDTYISQPTGYEKYGNDGKKEVWKLNCFMTGNQVIEISIIYCINLCINLLHELMYLLLM